MLGRGVGQHVRSADDDTVLASRIHNSEAAVAITTGMLGEMADNPEIGRAEALRRSMLAMMETEGKDHFAHPMFWAPFVVVGEGGVAAVN